MSAKRGVNKDSQTDDYQTHMDLLHELQRLTHVRLLASTADASPTSGHASAVRALFDVQHESITFPKTNTSDVGMHASEELIIRIE